LIAQLEAASTAFAEERLSNLSTVRAFVREETDLAAYEDMLTQVPLEGCDFFSVSLDRASIGPEGRALG
jgi:hypothetical protein